MKRKCTKKPIDLTSYGPVNDVSGYRSYLDNLGEVLKILVKRKRLARSQKVAVEVDKVGYNKQGSDSVPYRYTGDRKYTVGNLLDFYKSETGQDFDIETHSLIEDKSNEKKQLERYCYEKNAESRTAWGVYSTIVRTSNKVKKEKSESRERQAKESQSLLCIG